MCRVKGKGNIPGAATERLSFGTRPLSTRRWLRESSNEASPCLTGLAVASAAKSAKRPTHERSMLIGLGAILLLLVLLREIESGNGVVAMVRIVNGMGGGRIVGMKNWEGGEIGRGEKWGKASKKM
jgi:hypothetical protein